FQSAKEYIDKAMTLATQQNNSEITAKALNLLGSISCQMGDNKTAIEQYSQALILDRKKFGDLHPAVSIDLNNIGETYRSIGKPKEAIKYFEEALLINKLYSHPNMAINLNNLGLAWKGLGDMQKAIGFYEEALKISTQVYGDVHPSIAIRLNNLGAAWIQ